VRVLRELSRHGGELAAASLVARTGLAQSSVREALIALRSKRIVESAGSGRAQLFRLSRDHPLAVSVAQLFEAEETRFEAVLSSVRMAAEPCGGILSAWIYGSVVRGQDRPDSDLDIAVVTEYGEATRVEEVIRGEMKAAEEALGFRSSVIVIDTRDVLRLSKERDPWWGAAIRDNLPIIGDRPEMLVAWLLQRSKRIQRSTK
jgi:predicted nucleotidyltransferase